MATMYCALCNRSVDAKRQIGAGTIILAFVTGGLWLVAIPFYQKRCAICKSAAVSRTAPGASTLSGNVAVARLANVEQKLNAMESELDTANAELDRLRAERDFYRDLVEDPVARERYRREKLR